MQEDLTPPEGTPTPAADPAPVEAAPVEAAPVEAAPASAPTAPTRRFSNDMLAMVALVAAGVAAVAVMAGAVIGHEVWTRTTSQAIVQTPSFQGGNGFGGNGGFGYGNPYDGGGTAGGSGSGTGTGSPSNVDQIAAKVDPAIVNITTSLGYQSAEAAGTGIVISSDGEVLTNNHVIDGATTITATDVGNGKSYTATVVGYDPSHDVAVLQLQDASGLQTASLGDSSKVSVGDAVVGIGNAGGGGGTPSAAGGSVTALNTSLTAENDLDGGSEQLTGMLEFDADIQPGDSGGPLVDSNGDVIGIDTAGSTSSGFTSFSGGGGGAYAIPIDDALAIVKQIESAKGSSTIHIGETAFLGVLIAPAGTLGSSGLTVSSVLDGKPAQQAGLAEGDVITSFDGQAVDSQSSLSTLLVAHHPGDTIQIAWTDPSGQSHTASVSLASGPPA